MQDISPLAWAGIFVILLIIVVLNIGLIAFLRYRPTLNIKPRISKSANNLNRFAEVVKDPFGEERKQLSELAGLVEKLENTTGNQKDVNER